METAILEIMTREEKKLLLVDLCARLPYHVMVHYHWSHESRSIDEDRELDFSDVETLQYNIENQNDWCEISWKPYLRPMSSMTSDEKMEWFQMRQNHCNMSGFNELQERADFTSESSDWLNKKGFDFRGLILMELALEAPDGMYKTE